MIFVYKTYTDTDEVRLDGHTFKHCKFIGSHLIYEGLGLVVFEHCTFKSPRFALEGPAKNTIDFLTGLYGSGEFGHNLVEKAFNQIRKIGKKLPKGPQGYGN